jgi:hypothetical protein
MKAREASMGKASGTIFVKGECMRYFAIPGVASPPFQRGWLREPR